MAMEDEWSDDIEGVLDNIRANCILLSEHHKQSYLYFKSYLKYFRVPTIIFSGINSVISIGLSTYVEQTLVSEITCVVSLICGIITSMELYLNIQHSMENELIASKEFYLLSTDIYKTICLDRKNRKFTGKSFLDDKYSTYCNLIENSNLINNEVMDSLTPIKVKNIVDNKVIDNKVIDTNTYNFDSQYIDPEAFDTSLLDPSRISFDQNTITPNLLNPNLLNNSLLERTSLNQKFNMNSLINLADKLDYNPKPRPIVEMVSNAATNMATTITNELNNEQNKDVTNKVINITTSLDDILSTPYSDELESDIENNIVKNKNA